jgi:hypothetical protein
MVIIAFHHAGDVGEKAVVIHGPIDHARRRQPVEAKQFRTFTSDQLLAFVCN